MEKELNIAAILKDKPAGTKLWSPVFGDCTLDRITSEDSLIWAYNTDRVLETFYPNGKYDRRGECVIFPSKQMRDWSKFAWKKGDVLVGIKGSKILFDKWVSEDFTNFLGKIKVLGNSHCYDTAYYTLASEEEALEFIKSVEEIHNGKLNRETLEIEKQSEFKPFDKVLVRDYLEDKWMPNFFSCYDGTSEYKYGCIAGNSDNVVFSKYCIPYNEETAHLLGTTDEWKGGIIHKCIC